MINEYINYQLVVEKLKKKESKFKNIINQSSVTTVTGHLQISVISQEKKNPSVI